MRRATAVVVAALALVGTAGCGSGADGAGDTSKAAFVAKANAICKAGNARLASFAAAIASAQRGSDEATVFAQLADITRDAARASAPFIDKLDALTAPDADRDALKQWIAATRRQQALVGTLARAFAARDQTKVATLSEQIDALNETSNAYAARYGMRECARDAG